MTAKKTEMTIQEIKNKQDMFNALASILFVGIIMVMSLMLAQFGSTAVYSISMGELLMITLALFRIIRLFVYDSITQFVRDLFLHVEYRGNEITRSKYDYGFKRSVSDILSCPWCVGIWAGSFLIFSYLLFAQYLFFVVLILAIAAVASFLQIFMNLIGWHAEAKKMEVQSKI